MIVKAGLEDMEDIYNLMCILENKELDKEHFVQTYQQNIQDENIIYLVYKEDRILGFISFVVHHYLHHDRDMGEIVELVVLPECRGKRIGQQLLQAIEKKAIDLHLEQIELSTSTYRKQAHHFYEQNGYEMSHYNYTKNL